MIERITSGDPRLDEVLCGGLVANAITLVVGAPGTGKTILAERCLFANATPQRRGLYLSTVSEPFDKLLRYAQMYTFFDQTAIGRAVFYEDLGDAVYQGGLNAVNERITSLVKAHNPGIVVIDSFKALRAFANDDAEFRRFLHDLAGLFSAVAISSLWVGEYEPGEATTSPEFAVADGVIALETKQTEERSIRYLSVRKLRGSDSKSGEHVYRITADGLKLFPRLADPRDTHAYPTNSERVSTGIAALDQVIQDGYWAGSTTLLVGPSGAGKTLMGLHFLYAGADRGEPGILLTLQENRIQLSRIIDGFGWNTEHPNVTIMDRSPVDVYLDELVYDLLDQIDNVGARRVVVDSFNDLSAAAPDPIRLREFLYSLVQRCARQGITLMFTYETVELFQISRLSDIGMSYMADNVILLQHVQAGHEMKRALSILKTRGSKSSAIIHEFIIEADGITLGHPVAPHAPQT